MDKLIKHAPKIIEAAAKSPLGIFALMILAMSVLGAIFFRDASEPTRAGIFILMLVGVAAFGFAAVRSMPRDTPKPQESSPSQEPQTPPPTAGSTQIAIISLRRKAQTVSADQVKIVLAKHGFYEKQWNAAGQGVAHQYQTQVLDDEVVVADGATELMWQKGGQQQLMFAQAGAYIKRLNAQRFAGFNDWRLPTVEEAMSLMQPETHGDMHIDPVFERGINFIWTADHTTDGRVWVLYFYDGMLAAEPEDFNTWVKAVRCA